MTSSRRQVVCGSPVRWSQLKPLNTVPPHLWFTWDRLAHGLPSKLWRKFGHMSWELASLGNSRRDHAVLCQNWASVKSSFHFTENLWCLPTASKYCCLLKFHHKHRSTTGPTPFISLEKLIDMDEPPCTHTLFHGIFYTDVTTLSSKWAPQIFRIQTSAISEIKSWAPQMSGTLSTNPVSLLIKHNSW